MSYFDNPLFNSFNIYLLSDCIMPVCVRIHQYIQTRGDEVTRVWPITTHTRPPTSALMRNLCVKITAMKSHSEQTKHQQLYIHSICNMLQYITIHHFVFIHSGDLRVVTGDMFPSNNMTLVMTDCLINIFVSISLFCRILH